MSDIPKFLHGWDLNALWNINDLTSANYVPHQELPAHEADTLQPVNIEEERDYLINQPNNEIGYVPTIVERIAECAFKENEVKEFAKENGLRLPDEKVSEGGIQLRDRRHEIKEFIPGKEVLENLGIRDFQLFELAKGGHLQPYDNLGKPIPSPDLIKKKQNLRMMQDELKRPRLYSSETEKEILSRLDKKEELTQEELQQHIDGMAAQHSKDTGQEEIRGR